jgi:hypothetical protein
MTDEDEKDKDKDNKDQDEQPDDGDDKDEHHGLEEEIEEILRQQGEKPGRAQRPRPPVQGLSGLPIPGLATFVLRYGFFLAVGIGLIFVLVRVLGPVAIRFVLMAAFVFLLFYTLRGLLQEIIRRRR